MTMLRPLEDRYISTEPQLRNMMAFAMGGRAAEEILFGQPSSGAHNDLENATRVARMMVGELGMSEKLGPVAFGQGGMRGADGQVMFPTGRPDVSEETARIMDEETSRLLREEYDRAREILEGKRELLARLSQLLMVRETLEGKELKGFVDGSIPIPDVDVERERVQAERAEEAEKREREAALAAARAAEETREAEALPPAPHLRDSSS
jgi:cell division protease FtsH